jgi:protein-disulfide isomerase
MDKRFVGILVAVALVFGGIFYFTNNKADAPSSSKGTPTSNIKGEGASGITLVEYGDFQCPACLQYEPLVRQVYETHKADIKLQFRNFPLFQIHQNAMAGAKAAEAAAKQGKFWEMHDKLYDTQDSWKALKNPQTAFEGYAGELGLNVEKFKTDSRSTATNSTIQADLNEGGRLGVDSTPTFFISDGSKGDPKKISNPTSLEEFNKVIDTAIEKKTGKKPAPAATPTPTATDGSTGTDTAQ